MRYRLLSKRNLTDRYITPQQQKNAYGDNNLVAWLWEYFQTY